MVIARGDSSYFCVRFSVPGQGQRRIGLKTMDEAEAYKRAELEYQRAVWSAEQRLLPVRTSLQKSTRSDCAASRS